MFLEYLYYIYKECIPDEAKSFIKDSIESIYPYLTSLLTSLESFYNYYCSKIIQSTLTFLGTFFLYPIGTTISQTINYVRAIISNMNVEPFFQWFRSMASAYMQEALWVLFSPILLIRDIIQNPLQTWRFILRFFRGRGGQRTQSGVLRY